MFLLLGQEWGLSPDLFDKLEVFTHASSMLTKPQLPKSMLLGTTYSVLRKVKLTVTSFHHAGIA